MGGRMPESQTWNRIVLVNVGKTSEANLSDSEAGDMRTMAAAMLAPSSRRDEQFLIRRRGRLSKRRPGIALMMAALFLISTPVIEVTAQVVSEQPTDFTVGGIGFLGNGPDMATIGAGGFNIINNDGGDTAAELRLEYRYGGKWYSLGPMIGILGTSEGGVFGYAGLYTDMRIGDRWIVTPAAGLGGYERGSGKDLGGTFQFHLGLDVSYQFSGGNRLGLKMAHISNAGLHDENPGVESALLTFTVPLSERRGSLR